MNNLEINRLRSAVAEKAAQGALERFQNAVNRATELSSQLDTLQDQFERAKNSLGSQLVEAERVREEARLEHEATVEFHREMQKSAQDEDLREQLRARGVHIPKE